MNKAHNYVELIDKLISINQAFAVWSMPGESTIKVIINDNSKKYTLENDSNLEDKSGFIFAPFVEKKDTPTIFINADLYLKTKDEVFNFDLDSLIPNITKKTSTPDPFVISRKEYTYDIEKVINTIKNSSLSKVIISRIIQENKGNTSIGELYVKIQEKILNTFVYLVHTPETGVWLGATPEILMKTDSIVAETVSLAGTQSIKNNLQKNYLWKTKDIEEQAFVSRYIVDALHDYKIHNYKTKGPESFECGQVVHLKTSFIFSKENISGKFSNFIKQMHPTPAVCGLPKDESRNFIDKVEKHDRRYYTGYLGPWKLDNEIGIFVNLRCMEITKHKYLLYVGGGITSRSNALDEWKETNKKARTLLSAIRS